MTAPSLSIRVRALLLVAVVAVPYTAFQIYAGVTAYRTAVRNAEGRVVSVAAATASALDQFLAITERSTGSLAERLGLELLTDEGCARTMGALGDAFPYFVNLLVVDASGALVCSARPTPEGQVFSAADRYWFQQVRAQRRFVVGRPVLGPVTEEWVVATGSPIVGADGEFLGAVAGTVGLLRIEDLLEGRAPGPNELVTITTNDGVVVARSVDAETWVGRSLPSGRVEVERRGPREFVTRTEDASGLARIWGRIDLPDYGLRVYLGVPADRVAGPTLANLRTQALVSMLALGAAFFVAILLVRGITRSMSLLSEGLDAAAAGDTVALPPSAPPEVRAVVTQLNRALQERRQAEASEREARERMQDILENAVFGICVTTAEGRFTQVNRAMVRMLGYESGADLLAAPLERLYVDPTAPAAMAAACDAAGVVEDHDLQLLARDGRPVRVRIQGKLRTRRSGERVFELIVEDVTEQHALEELTRHQQKMEAVGRLAGGIAHEFNNLLTVLGVNSELIRTALGADHELAIEAQEVEVALGRAGGLTRKLLAFSRKEVTQPCRLDINAVMSGLEGMLRRVLSETVELETDLARSVGAVWIDPGHLEQVVLNLVLNARDAFGPAGGCIRISTATRAGTFPMDDDATTMGPARWYTVLTVADDGPGMEKSVRDLVFEPFFTTKPPGIGTGLGLPTVYGIVTDAGGRLELETEPGEGATFEIWLPVAADDVDDDLLPEPSGGGTVLLVAGNAPLRTLTRTALEAAGHTVLEATSGTTALDVFWHHGGAVDALVSGPDVRPVSGDPVIDRLRREQPGLPHVTISARRPAGVAPDRREGVLNPPFGPRRVDAVLQPLMARDGHAPAPGRGH